MAVETGDRLGPYILISLIGEGGMGEVWKARDTRLDRLVAIKTSRSQFEDRFAREARAIASLNHPNICSLYDVGPDYLVMEFVEGKPVARIEDPRKLLDIATQIADGLQAAHAAGFLHRDLKPDNILISREGRVKILDFGLAKHIGVAGASDATRSIGLTADGAVAGTPAYMSPEQASGTTEIDVRSDQFSFGLVLYELASGKRAFRRSTAVETMAAIVSEDPEPLDASLPAPLRWIIERCLSKDRERRYYSTRDLYEELRLMPIRLSSGTTKVLVPARRRNVPLPAWIAAALALGFVAAAFIPVPSAGPGRTTPFATEAEIQSMPAWAPNGERIAYAADVDGIFQIFTKQIRSSARTQRTKQDVSCSNPFWAPDGARIFYSAGRDLGDTSLWSISLGGGPPEKVLDDISQAALSPDGRTLAVLQREPTGLYRLAFSAPPGSPPTPYAGGPVSQLRPISSDGFLRFSRDGRYLGFYTDAGGRVAFWMIPMENGRPGPGGGAVEVSKGTEISRTQPFDWLPDNLGIVSVFRDADGDNSLGTWAFQRGIQRQLTASTAREECPAVSPVGHAIAYATGSKGYDVIEVPLDGSPPRDLIATSRNEVAPSAAPDGTHFAYISDRRGTEEMWLRNRLDGSERMLVGGEETRYHGSSLLDTAISPDGRRVAYRRIFAGEIEIWIAPLSGEAPVRLWQDPARTPQRGAAWSPDGNWIAYYSSRDGKTAIFKARVGANAKPELLAYSTLLRPVRWSPRGDWIAFDDTAGLRLVSPDGKRDHLISQHHWLTYGWSNDGTSLYGIAPSENRRLILARLDVVTGRETKIGDLGPLTAAMDFANFGRGLEYRGFSLSPDGKSFLTSVYRAKMDIWLLEDFDKSSRLIDWLFRRQ